MPHPIFNEVLQLVKDGDIEQLKTYLKQNLDFQDLSIFKCATCGEIIGVAPKHLWVANALGGSNPLLEYYILTHMRDNLSHSITVDIGFGVNAPIGGMIMAQMRKACELHGITLDEGFEKRLPYLKDKIDLLQ